MKARDSSRRNSRSSENAGDLSKKKPSSFNGRSPRMPDAQQPAQRTPPSSDSQVSVYERAARDLGADYLSSVALAPEGGRIARYQAYDFSGLNLGDRGASAVVEALKLDQAFASVSFASNGLRDVGVQAICELLARHPTAMRVDLSANPLSRSAGLAILRMLLQNAGIVEVGLAGTKLDPGLQAQIETNVDENKKIVSARATKGRLGQAVRGALMSQSAPGQSVRAAVPASFGSNSTMARAAASASLGLSSRPYPVPPAPQPPTKPPAPPNAFLPAVPGPAPRPRTRGQESGDAAAAGVLGRPLSRGALPSNRSFDAAGEPSSSVSPGGSRLFRGHGAARNASNSTPRERAAALARGEAAAPDARPNRGAGPSQGPPQQQQQQRAWPDAAPWEPKTELPPIAGHGTGGESAREARERQQRIPQAHPQPAPSHSERDGFRSAREEARGSRTPPKAAPAAPAAEAADPLQHWLRQQAGHRGAQAPPQPGPQAAAPPQPAPQPAPAPEPALPPPPAPQPAPHSEAATHPARHGAAPSQPTQHAAPHPQPVSQAAAPPQPAPHVAPPQQPAPRAAALPKPAPHAAPPQQPAPHAAAPRQPAPQGASAPQPAAQAAAEQPALRAPLESAPPERPHHPTAAPPGATPPPVPTLSPQASSTAEPPSAPQTALSPRRSGARAEESAVEPPAPPPASSAGGSYVSPREAGGATGGPGGGEEAGAAGRGAGRGGARGSSQATPRGLSAEEIMAEARRRAQEKVAQYLAQHRAQFPHAAAHAAAAASLGGPPHPSSSSSLAASPQAPQLQPLPDAAGRPAPQAFSPPASAALGAAAGMPAAAGSGRGGVLGLGSGREWALEEARKRAEDQVAAFLAKQKLASAVAPQPASAPAPAPAPAGAAAAPGAHPYGNGTAHQSAPAAPGPVAAVRRHGQPNSPSGSGPGGQFPEPQFEGNLQRRMSVSSWISDATPSVFSEATPRQPRHGLSHSMSEDLGAGSERSFGTLSSVGGRRDVFNRIRHRKYHEVEALLDAGTPLEARDKRGNTPLIVAVQNNNKRIAKLLLRRGANINAQNFQGNTALHHAFAFSYQELAQYLISKGADDTIVNAAGQDCYASAKAGSILPSASSASLAAGHAQSHPTLPPSDPGPGGPQMARGGASMPNLSAAAAQQLFPADPASHYSAGAPPYPGAPYMQYPYGVQQTQQGLPGGYPGMNGFGTGYPQAGAGYPQAYPQATGYAAAGYMPGYPGTLAPGGPSVLMQAVPGARPGAAGAVAIDVPAPGQIRIKPAARGVSLRPVPE